MLGKDSRTACGVPSAEALSTTTIVGRSGSAVRRASVASSPSRLLRVAITTVRDTFVACPEWP